MDVNLSPERPSQVLRRDNGIIATKKQLENTYQFIIYNTRSDPYQSEHTIITEVVAAKKIVSRSLCVYVCTVCTQYVVCVYSLQCIVCSVLCIMQFVVCV